MKFKEWDGKPLTGKWDFTIKVDGIQAKASGKKLVSKNGKPLYHIPEDERNFEIAEIFVGTCGATWSIISASKSQRRDIKKEEIFPLFPKIDPRLYITTEQDPTSTVIKRWMRWAVRQGHEGLVLRQGDNYIKVKTVYTQDVIVKDCVEGKGKFKGMLGKFITESGDCGVGFTNTQRKEFWKKRKQLLNTYIEVKSMETTKNGKLRNPRFVRLRPDK